MKSKVRMGYSPNYVKNVSVLYTSLQEISGVTIKGNGVRGVG